MQIANTWKPINYLKLMQLLSFFLHRLKLIQFIILKIVCEMYFKKVKINCYDHWGSNPIQNIGQFFERLPLDRYTHCKITYLHTVNFLIKFLVNLQFIRILPILNTFNVNSPVTVS